MPRKLRTAHLKPATEEGAKGKSIVPFAADEAATREAAEADHRNPAEETTTPPKDDWRACPNANGPQPGDFGDRG